ncbi:hypothetical protein [Sinisalibacter aestuarii]|uniref:Uncharacterized protein n=1 Tax=Sinisalibacter aestuarii TaxID=2949426 RepID=A0ABQ5LSU4_9RHOB|nr:hypothetical protein [Sinisalibacter aestuarii]GKY88066.1 hypothetical protein STA1M1_19350 [Sinisalibacter aestuarii]
MAQDWIVDVLADLRAYAEMGGLPATAASLEDAMLIALAETASIAPAGEADEGTAPRDPGTNKVTWLFTGRG